jgi:hypothetical protein
VTDGIRKLIIAMEQKTFKQTEGNRFFGSRQGKLPVPGAGYISLLTWPPIRETDPKTGNARQNIVLQWWLETVWTVPIQQPEK